MQIITIKCGSDSRRSVVKDHSTVNGIDYLDIYAVPLADGSHVSNPLLLLHCFKTVEGLTKENVVVSGGVRVKDIKVEWGYIAKDFATVHAGDASAEELEIINNIEGSPSNVLVIRLGGQGDFSTYEIRLVKSASESEMPPANFDIILSQTEFSFKVECPSDFDCACIEKPSQEQLLLTEPALDYMAKDYASFRRLVLDRLSLIMPDWKERNPADIGVMLVELLAYMGDHLSYYQDAVGTEAYLGTARKRISARRHARLLDYFVHDGCNARAWVCVQTGSDTIELPQGTQFLTMTREEDEDSDDNNNSPVIFGDSIEEEIAKGAEAFETMYGITLYEGKNKISFYTWGETDCWLPRGSTRATLKNTLASLDVFVWENVPGQDSDKLVDFLTRNFALDWLKMAEITKSGNEIKISYKDDLLTITLGSDDKATLSINDENAYEFDVMENLPTHEHMIRSSTMRVGDVLVFEEVESPSKGSPPDPSHCHVVRLTSVITGTDGLNGTKVIEIKWDQQDALPFQLCLAKDGKQLGLARGNVVLADHGYTRTEDLEISIVGGRRYYPKLSRKPLTHRGPSFEIAVGTRGSAASAFGYDIREVRPAVFLERKDDPGTWKPQRDLLASNEFAREFVVETESDGTAFIRFSNSNRINWAEQQQQQKTESGKFRPFKATYRIGNGKKGNVGPYTIKRLFAGKGKDYSSIRAIFNPMAATGGQGPETLESIRQHAPQAFRTQERAVTEADYTEVLIRHPQVQRAVAMKRWTGSWHTMFVTVDRVGGLAVDSEFKAEIAAFLEKYRLAGYDVEINEPIYMPLNIALRVCLKKGYFASEVKEELLKTFSSSGTLEDGRKGFFHPDNFTFGQPLYLSKLYEAAMGVDGVSSVEVTTFQRWGKVASNELDHGVIKADTLEIIRLDNDPNFAENGIIKIDVCGGI